MSRSGQKKVKKEKEEEEEVVAVGTSQGRLLFHSKNNASYFKKKVKTASCAESDDTCHAGNKSGDRVQNE